MNGFVNVRVLCAFLLLWGGGGGGVGGGGGGWMWLLFLWFNVLHGASGAWSEGVRINGILAQTSGHLFIPQWGALPANWYKSIKEKENSSYLNSLEIFFESRKYILKSIEINLAWNLWVTVELSQ